jgi:hypothetical protein
MTQFDASASAVGHLHQMRWALLELLRAGRRDKTVRVSLETYDDIALIDGAGDLAAAKQIKHHHAPATLTDGSEDLWKTLRVWLASPRLRDANGPKLFLLTTASVATGSAVDKLTRENRAPDEAAGMLTALAKKLSGKSTSTGREAWLEATPAERTALLKRVTIVSDAPSADKTDDLLKEELATGVREEHMDLVLERLWGWWYQYALRILMAAGVETVSADQLYRRLHEIRDDFRGDSLPLDLSLLDVGESELESHLERPFVRQLEWIGVHSNNLRKAMVNYHRAYTQTAKWVMDGDLVEDDLRSFESELRDEWEIQFENMCDRLADEEPLTEGIKRRAGRELFNVLYDTNIVRIRASFSEHFLTNGARHMLADKGELGWHPDFRARVAELLGVVA